MKTINKLIINNPYQEPTEHWLYQRKTQNSYIQVGRRPAGYVIATPGAKSHDDPGIFREIPLVNKIRPLVKSWREAGYPGTTGITQRLLEHWKDKEREKKFFFCQLEAIETIIWLTEAPAAGKVGINIPSDGGDFSRWCSKMATGTGKTIIMAMILAWQFLNKSKYPQDTRFNKYALIIAPNLTIKSRLQILQPAHEQNYYQAFNIVPSELMDTLRQGKIVIHNWHTLAWDTQDQIDTKVQKRQLRSVDKRQRLELSGTAYAKQVLGELATKKNIVVINDEAHHAWRIPADSKIKGVKKTDLEESTIWVGGLDRIHKTNGILRCFDLSATPFAPFGTNEESLFSWIVSDFGLNDAIESGLVKTPRVVIRDDSILVKDLKSRLYHLYNDGNIKDDINRKAEPTEPLPDLLINAYYLLGLDWRATQQEWQRQGKTIPPVMITIANRTETSARIKYAFENQQILIPELCEAKKLLQIDSSVEFLVDSSEPSVDSLEFADSDESLPTEKISKKQQHENLRKIVDTVGQEGQPGEQMQHVIAVGMLSEGWDAKTVTHIMGLRAFSSQLLCEQVVGRGLRRVSYDDFDEKGLFIPEYVNIFGVPFTFIPYEGSGVEGSAPPPAAKTPIGPVAEKKEHEITFPNVLRIDYRYKSKLTLDWDKVQPLELDAFNSITEVELAAIIDGKPNAHIKAAINLDCITPEMRVQTIIFKVAARIYNAKPQLKWHDSKEMFLIQLVRLVEQFIHSKKIKVQYNLFNLDKQKVLLILNMNTIVQHIWSEIRIENTQALVPIFDKEQPIRSTANVDTWWTSKPCEPIQKSHISHCVYDSNWEASEAYILERSEHVTSFVKNDHLGFVIFYNYQGIIKKYYPDFIIRLTNGEHLILEVKGQEDGLTKTKHEFLSAWVTAVNEHGGFGQWKWDVSYHPGDLKMKLATIFL